MTPFVPANIPPSVNTVEKLNTWTAMILNQLYATQTAIEGDGLPQRVAQYGVYNVPNDNSVRVLLRTSFKIENNFGSSGQKVYSLVDDLGSDAIPTEYLS